MYNILFIVTYSVSVRNNLKYTNTLVFLYEKNDLCFPSQNKPQEHLVILHNCVTNHKTCCSFLSKIISRTEFFLFFKKTHWLYAVCTLVLRHVSLKDCHFIWHNI